MATEKKSDEALLAQGARAQDPDEEYVTVALFCDGDKYKDDVFVSVNGENCLIKRGTPVQIKRKFANVLDQSDAQDKDTMTLISRYHEAYREAARSST